MPRPNVLTSSCKERSDSLAPTSACPAATYVQVRSTYFNRGTCIASFEVRKATATNSLYMLGVGLHAHASMYNMPLHMAISLSPCQAS
eukprot:1159925-Pelagomonas_calceolata.AAC.3